MCECFHVSPIRPNKTWERDMKRGGRWISSSPHLSTVLRNSYCISLFSIWVNGTFLVLVHVPARASHLGIILLLTSDCFCGLIHFPGPQMTMGNFFRQANIISYVRCTSWPMYHGPFDQPPLLYSPLTDRTESIARHPKGKLPQQLQKMRTALKAAEASDSSESRPDRRFVLLGAEGNQNDN